MTPLDHLKATADIFNRALLELPKSQRDVFSDLVQPHFFALSDALTPKPVEKS